LFPIYRALLSRANFGGRGKTFSYYFDCDTELNAAKRVIFNKGECKGASHADELFYLFSTDFLKTPESNSTEFGLIKRMVTLWTEFAINGNWNAMGNEVDWKPVGSSSEAFNFLGITNDGMKMIELPERERLEVWINVYEDAGKLLF